MNVDRQIAVLEKAAGSGTVVACRYCGAATPVFGSIGVCHGCENVVSLSRDALAKRSSDIVAALDSINAQLASGMYDGATAAYDALYAKYADPALLYVEGLVCNMQSNHEVGLISYDREGFMEENTLHRDAAARHAARARLLFNKAISACNAVLSKESSPDVMFVAFLANIKLGNLRNAESLLGALTGSGSHYLSMYATMVLDSAAGRFDRVPADAERLMKPDAWSINAFFYMALALLKKGDAKGALKLVGALKKNVSSAAIDALAREAAGY